MIQTWNEFLALIRAADRKTKLGLALGIGLGFVAFGIELGFAAILQAFLSVVLGANLPLPGPMAKLELTPHFVLIALAVAGVLRATILYTRSLLMAALAQHFIKLQRTNVLANFLSTFRAETSTGTLIFLLNEAAQSAGTIVASCCALVISTVILSAGITSLMLISWQQTCVVLLIGGITGLLLRGFQRKIASLGTSIQKNSEGLASRLISAARNILFLEISGENERERRRLNQSLNENFRFQLSYFKISYLGVNAPNFIAPLMLAGIAAFALQIGEAQNANLIPFFYLVLRVAQNLSESLGMLNEIQVRLPSARLLLSLHRDQPSISHGARKLAKQGKGLHLQLKNVGFKFSAPLFSNLNLEIKPGQLVALLGPSGSGKSTLLALLAGVRRPTEGNIFIDTVPIQEWDSSSLKAVLGYAGPDPYLIEGTVRDNLLYGVSDTLSEVEIQAALQAAECEFILNEPSALDRRLSDFGEGFSTGQKQRLSLARALLRKPRLLLLDEATGNLDSAIEARVVSRLAALKSQMTIVAATHREAILKIADQVLDFSK